MKRPRFLITLVLLTPLFWAFMCCHVGIPREMKNTNFSTDLTNIGGEYFYEVQIEFNNMVLKKRGADRIVFEFSSGDIKIGTIEEPITNDKTQTKKVSKSFRIGKEIQRKNMPIQTRMVLYKKANFLQSDWLPIDILNFD